MNPSHAGAAAGGPWVYIVPLLIAGLVMLRNSRARRLRVEMMWIMPTVLLAITGLMLWTQPIRHPLAIVFAGIAFVAGAALGFWRGRLTHITVDPETHALTSKASPVGMILILVVFGARYALRSFGTETAGMLHVSVAEITDILMLLAVGIVCTQRLEMALRATRLVAEHRTA
jgi:hypothetical protein